MSTAETLRITQPAGDPAPEALAEQLRSALAELEAERAERERAEAVLAEATKGQALLERDKTLAEAMAVELQRQVEHLSLERDLLQDRLAQVTSERDRAIAAMGRWARNRFQRQQSVAADHR